MTSSDGIMIMMIRHVYVCLRLVGPEETPPPHVVIMCQNPMADRVNIIKIILVYNSPQKSQ